MRMRSWRKIALVTVLLLGTTALGAAPASAAPMCFGKRATLVGTDGKDKLVGTAGPDVIVARGGHDHIRSKGGNDRVCAGKGGDEILSGGGKDKIDAGRGSDFFKAGSGNDRAEFGGGFFDFGDGGRGDDTIVGLPLDAEQGTGFELVGYLFAKRAVTVDLANGTATGQGSDTLVDIDGADGSTFDDQLTGTSGSNFFFGGEGNDTINSGGNAGESTDATSVDEFRFDFVLGGPGNDTITGGSGVTVLGYDNPEGPIDADLQTGTIVASDQDAGGTDTVDNVQGVLGTVHDDSFRGDQNNNLYEPEGGADTIDGRGGDDTLALIDGDTATVDLAAGSATTTYRPFTDQGRGDPVTATSNVTSIEHIWGTNGPDTLSGDDGGNIIFGREDNDTLNGRAASDTLIGEGGTDSADGGDGSDVCDAEAETNCESDPPALFARAVFAGWWRLF